MSSSSILLSLVIHVFLSTVSEAAFKLPKPLPFFSPSEKTLKPFNTTYTSTFEFSTQNNPIINLVLDLSAQHTWFNCDDYNLPTYRPITRGTTKWKNANSIGCTNDTCFVSSYNPFTAELYGTGLGEDFVFLYSTDGRYKSPRQFPFSPLCSFGRLNRPIRYETKGITGLAMGTTSLHSQVYQLADF